MINELVNNLRAITDIVDGKEISFDDALSIVKRYDEMPDPNDLIDEAEVLAAHSIDVLEESIISLKEESDRFLRDALPLLKPIDFRAISQNYSRRYYERFSKAQEELNPYWKEYCRYNNRLDYLDYDSEEYRETERLCEEAKAAHDERQKEVRRLFCEYDQANKVSGPVFLFKSDYLEVIVTKYLDIAGAILADIDRIRKEGAS